MDNIKPSNNTFLPNFPNKVMAEKQEKEWNKGLVEEGVRM